MTFSPRQGSSLRRAEFCWQGVSSGVYGAINNVHGKLFSKLRIDPNGGLLVRIINIPYGQSSAKLPVIRSLGHLVIGVLRVKRVKRAIRVIGVICVIQVIQVI